MRYFNYYHADIEKSKPLGIVSVMDFFKAIENPKPHIKSIYEEIYKCEMEGDMTRKAELKTKLYSFTPCVIIHGRRRYEDISKFTGLMMLDFDHIDNASEFKAYLFNTYNFIIGTWLSASKRGVRALVNIPVVDSVEEFKQYFEGLKHFEMGRYIGFDSAPKNCVLPLFLSYDPDIYIGDTEHVWNTKYTPLPQTPIIQYKYTGNPNKIEKITKSAIDKITENGHPQLRAASFVLGGYVGAGYIGQDEAIQLIDHLIETNPYLSIKPPVYKKTAREMIEQGKNQPLYL